MLTIIAICAVFVGVELLLTYLYSPYFVKKKETQVQQYITRRGDIHSRKMAITLDAHSDAIVPEIALQILDVLKNQGIKATFFLTGEFIEKYPDITRRIALDGHEVGSHLYSHTHADELTNKQFKDELLGSAKIYESTTGKKMAPYWRAPGSVKYTTKLKLAHKLGFDCMGVSLEIKSGKVIWDLDSYDWVKDKDDYRYFSAEENKVRLLSSFDRNGGIALFHLANRVEDPLYPKLPEIFDGLRAQGYELTDISGLPKK